MKLLGILLLCMVLTSCQNTQTTEKISDTEELISRLENVYVPETYIVEQYRGGHNAKEQWSFTVVGIFENQTPRITNVSGLLPFKVKYSEFKTCEDAGFTEYEGGSSCSISSMLELVENQLEDLEWEIELNEKHNRTTDVYEKSYLDHGAVCFDGSQKICFDEDNTLFYYENPPHMYWYLKDYNYPPDSLKARLSSYYEKK